MDKVQMEGLGEEQRTLAGPVDIEAFRALVRSCNDTPIYIPKIESLEKPMRDELVREEFDGRNYHEFALKYGLTEAWTRNIVIEEVRKIKTRPANDRIPLKGILC